MPAQTIFLTAAEASGDDHAAVLIEALRRRYPDARFVGAAGPRMIAAGCESVLDLTAHASMAGGPLFQLRFWKRAIRTLSEAMADARPDLHIPVDSPAMNWHLAKTAKSLGVPVLYYIAPQVWAWAPWRIKKVRRLTDHVACILPFEESYFRSRGVDATYVGHPLFDRLPAHRTPEQCPDLTAAWADGAMRVALLPGSRPSEIAGHAPGLLATAADICSHWPDATCTFTARDELAAQRIRAAVDDAPVNVAVGRTAEVLADAHFAVAASGTVTLEVAHFGVPMVILHRLRGIERLLYPIVRRLLIRTKYLSLPNILAGRGVVPELMPWYGNAGQLMQRVRETMSDLGWLWTTRRKLLDITAPLQNPPGATAGDRTAAIAEELIGSRQ